VREEPKKAKIGLLLLGAILVAATALLFFGWLAEEVLEADTQRFDTLLRTAIHRLASPPITSIMELISLLGSVGVLVVLSVLAISHFCYFHRPREATMLGITMAGVALLDLVLKHAFHRIRPLAFFGTSPSSYSFPSGHALALLCFYGALAAILSARIAGRRARFMHLDDRCIAHRNDRIFPRLPGSALPKRCHRRLLCSHCLGRSRWFLGQDSEKAAKRKDGPLSQQLKGLEIAGFKKRNLKMRLFRAEFRGCCASPVQRNDAPPKTPRVSTTGQTPAFVSSSMRLAVS
jgi:hypothetical protein